MFLVALTEGIDQLRLKRMLFEPTSEPKASDTSRVVSSEAKPSKAKAPRRPAKPAPVPAVDLSSVIRPVDGLAKPLTEAAKQGAREAKALQPAKATKGLEDVPTQLLGSFIEQSTETPSESQPAASADAALKDLGLGDAEVGENPFDALNDPAPKPRKVPEPEVGENPFDALNDDYQPPARSA